MSAINCCPMIKSKSELRSIKVPEEEIKTVEIVEFYPGCPIVHTLPETSSLESKKSAVDDFDEIKKNLERIKKEREPATSGSPDGQGFVNTNYPDPTKPDGIYDEYCGYYDPDTSYSGDREILPDFVTCLELQDNVVYCNSVVDHINAIVSAFK